MTIVEGPTFFFVQTFWFKFKREVDVVNTTE